jgi:hypothetical protein
MFKPRYIIHAALATIVLTSCGGNQADTGVNPSAGYASVRVENQNSRDMRIYVRPNAGGARFRLGTANALETTLLKIPRTMVTGVTDLVFEITPIGGGGSSFSERITASPGEEIVLRIGP